MKKSELLKLHIESFKTFYSTRNGVYFVLNKYDSKRLCEMLDIPLDYLEEVLRKSYTYYNKNHSNFESWYVLDWRPHITFEEANEFHKTRNESRKQFSECLKKHYEEAKK